MNWIREIASWTVVAWLLAACALNIIGLLRMFGALTAKPDNWSYRVTRAVFWELRPFFVPAAIVKTALAIVAHDFDWLDAAVFVLNLWNWWLLKDPGNDDDDRWKRRGEKLKSKVQVEGSRLVVAPVGAR